MSKVFNVTGACVPWKHYMADMTGRVREIRKMVDAGEYFTINRARQYGKTTTLMALDRGLKKDYLVIWLDFQSLGSASYQNENVFALSFLQIFCHLVQFRRMVFIMLQHVIQNSGHLILCFRNFMAVIMAMVPAVRRASLAAGMCLGLMAVGMFLFMAVLMAVGMRMLIRMSMRMLMFMTMTD